MSLRAARWRSNLPLIRRLVHREENRLCNETDVVMPWDLKQYHKFQAERAAPFFDLLALVQIRPNLKVVDLGCGTGELTRQLADALPNSDVTGLDSSPQMLEKSASFSSLGLRFERGDQA